MQAPVTVVRTHSEPERRVRLGMGIPRGAGRSFGDVSLPDRSASIQLDPGEEDSRVRWSSERGVVVCSAAASLDASPATNLWHPCDVPSAGTPRGQSPTI